MSQQNISSEFDVHVFSSGMRLLHKKSSGPVSHLAIVIKAGSRDEQEEEQGLAHYVEHCLFKGTRHRKTYHILSRLDDVGGELNAFTGKEDTTLYATVLKKDYGRAAELLLDIAFHSTFPEKEILKEKEVIADEIDSYRDSPSDHIFDLFDEQLFPGHPLGRNILGTRESLRSFDRTNLTSFVSRLYRPENIILASSGQLSLPQVLRAWSKAIPAAIESHSSPDRIPPLSYSPSATDLSREQVQTHCIMGNRAYPSGHDNALALYVVNNILGGPTMNNRLNLNIRERYGLTYNLESFYSPMSDTGTWGVYLSTDPGYAERVIQLVFRELKQLRERPLGVLQLSKAKRQVQGQIAMAQENPGSAVGSAARAWLHRDEIEPLEKTLERIEKLTAKELMDAANEVFDPHQLSSIILRGQGIRSTENQ